MCWENNHTALKHKHFTTYLSTVHALTGCDTVSYLFGNGKATALKVLLGGQHLIELGQQGADEGKLISEATTFVAACYGSKVEGDMILTVTRSGSLKWQIQRSPSSSSSPSSYSHFYVGSMYDDIRLHVARSYTSSADSPFSLMSSFTLSNHILLGLPLFLLPCTFIIIALLPT